MKQARSKTAALLTTYPEAPDLHQRAAKIFAGCGDKSNAVAEAERAIASLPLGKNADGGLYPLETLAEAHPTKLFLCSSSYSQPMVPAFSLPLRCFDSTRYGIRFVVILVFKN